MHLTVDLHALVDELRLLNKVTPTKAPLPILTHILMQTTDKGLQMYATDLEAGLLTTCHATVEAQGVVALPAATLLAMVERFTHETITITANKKAVHVSCGAFTSRLQSLPTIDFPKIPDVVGNTASINSLGFQQMLSRTRYALSDATNQFLLRGALLTLNDSVGAMVGLDGKRLALATMPRTGPALRATIPIKTLDLLRSMPDLPEEMTITVGDRHLFFQMGRRLLVSRMLEGEFPKFERAIPQDNDKKATISRAMLAQVLRRVGLIAGDDRAARFTFNREGLEITSSSAEVGEAGEKVSMQYDSDPVSLWCNWQFVVDFLEAATAANITIAMKDNKTPLLLTEGDTHLAVIMLMQG